MKKLLFIITLLLSMILLIGCAKKKEEIFLKDGKLSTYGTILMSLGDEKKICTIDFSFDMPLEEEKPTFSYEGKNLDFITIKPYHENEKYIDQSDVEFKVICIKEITEEVVLEKVILETKDKRYIRNTEIIFKNNEKKKENEMWFYDLTSNTANIYYCFPSQTMTFVVGGYFMENEEEADIYLKNIRIIDNPYVYLSKVALLQDDAEINHGKVQYGQILNEYLDDMIDLDFENGPYVHNDSSITNWVVFSVSENEDLADEKFGIENGRIHTYMVNFEFEFLYNGETHYIQRERGFYFYDFSK